MNEKNSFVLYRDLYSQMTRLSPEDRGELFLAILEYENFGEVVTPLSPLADLAFSFIQATLDRDRAAYEARCQQNRENGKKGGRPRKNASPQKTDGLFSKPEKAYSDNDSDSDSDNDSDSGNDNGVSGAPLLSCVRDLGESPLPNGPRPFPTAPHREESFCTLFLHVATNRVRELLSSSVAIATPSPLGKAVCAGSFVRQRTE